MRSEKLEQKIIPGVSGTNNSFKEFHPKTNYYKATWLFLCLQRAKLLEPLRLS